MTLTQPQVGYAGLHGHAISSANDLISICLTIDMLVSSSTATYPTADLAIYVPVRVKTRVVVRKMLAAIATASGNVDIGIYNAGGTRLVSTSTTAAAAPLVVDVTDTTLGPGLHYLAVVADNTTITFDRDNPTAPTLAASGVLTEQLGAGAALPATATWAVNQTLAYLPMVAALLVTEVS